MIKCKKCMKILDYKGIGLEYKLCTDCIIGGALAEPKSVVNFTRDLVNKETQEIKLKFEYVWFKDQWVLEIRALLPGNQEVSFRILKGQLELWLEEMTELEKEREEPE